MPPQDPVAVLNALAGARPGRLQHAFMLPGRTGTTVPPPEWIHPLLLASLRQSGTMGDRVWGHQRTGAELVRAGRDVVVATGAGSGKSLVYLLPSLTAILEARDAGVGGPTLLYLAPTKALGADQLQKVLAWDLPGIRAASYDGDTEAEERRWVRRHANTVFTNPDLLHHGILPNHPSWESFLRRLRYVVVDECHTYHGVFGSQVSAVLRRLRRVCRLYHVDPTFVLASATVAEPGELAGALTGRPVEVVTEDGSPHGSLLVGLWDGIESTGPPSVVDAAAGPVAARGSSVLEEATALLLDLVRAEVQTVVFARSR
ncbi:MAG TPA: DEAD/DEAH box helicase, partial [Dermatophilaceae bacterium]|nr:DEAD/DEAH box helicase [Dermatophilaceae bacterium]